MRGSHVLFGAAAAIVVAGPAAAGPVKEAYPEKGFTIEDFGKKGSTTGKYGDSKELRFNDKSYTLSISGLHPIDVSSPKKSTEVNFDTVLAAAFPKYTFNYTGAGGKDLALADNTLLVKTYDAKTTFLASVDFYVAYAGTAPKGGNVHWIQVIKNNWKVTGDPYEAENRVDNGTSLSPYYDGPYFAAGTFARPDDAFLSDLPKRDLAGLAKYKDTPIFWTAETYLVEQTVANDKGGWVVNIYDGVRWGWTITAIPEPATWAMMLTGFGLAGSVLRRRRGLAAPA